MSKTISEMLCNLELFLHFFHSSFFLIQHVQFALFVCVFYPEEWLVTFNNVRLWVICCRSDKNLFQLSLFPETWQKLLIGFKIDWLPSTLFAHHCSTHVQYDVSLGGGSIPMVSTFVYCTYDVSKGGNSFLCSFWLFPPVCILYLFCYPFHSIHPDVGEWVRVEPWYPTAEVQNVRTLYMWAKGISPPKWRKKAIGGGISTINLPSHWLFHLLLFHFRWPLYISCVAAVGGS